MPTWKLRFAAEFSIEVDAFDDHDAFEKARLILSEQGMDIDNMDWIGTDRVETNGSIDA